MLQKTHHVYIIQIKLKYYHGNNPSWLRRLVATLSATWPGLYHGIVHMRFVVDKVASGRKFPGNLDRCAVEHICVI